MCKERQAEEPSRHSECDHAVAAGCGCKHAATALEQPPPPVETQEYALQGFPPKRIQTTNKQSLPGFWQPVCFQTSIRSPRRKKPGSQIILSMNNRSILVFIACRLTKPIQMHLKKFSLLISLRVSPLSQAGLFTAFKYY